MLDWRDRLFDSGRGRCCIGRIAVERGNAIEVVKERDLVVEGGDMLFKIEMN
jgi:hypothetical protein